MRERRVLRVNFHCNQACGFCYVARELTMPDPATVFARIDDAAAHDAESRALGRRAHAERAPLQYIAHARRAGIRDLELQTNAVKMAESGVRDRARRERADARVREPPWRHGGRLGSGDVRAGDLQSHGPGARTS